MTNICEICQLYSPTAGCTKLENESCLKEALKLIKPSVTNGEMIQKTFPNVRLGFDIEYDTDWWNRKWGE